MKIDKMVLMPPGWDCWQSRAGYVGMRFDASTFGEDQGLGVAWTETRPTARLVQRDVARIVGVPVEKWGGYYEGKPPRSQRLKCPTCGRTTP